MQPLRTQHKTINPAREFQKQEGGGKIDFCGFLVGDFFAEL